MGTLYDKVAIVGHSTTNFGDLYEFGISDIANLAIHGALKSAKMNPTEIDSLYVGNAGAGQFLGQEHLGSLISTESELNCPAIKIEASGASGAAAMRVAAHGILTGYLERVAIVGVEKMTSFTKSSETQAALSTSLDTIWESSMGGTLPGNFALMARSHMRKYGTTPEQLAQVAVKNHENARKNPRAQFKNKLRVESILASKYVADPIHLFESCAASDGGSALILTNPDIAESYDPEPIYMRASKQAHDRIGLNQREEIYKLKSVEIAAEAGYRQLGIGPGDISVTEVHDVYTIAEIMAIEALGLVEYGQGGKATAEERTAIDGDIPVNTSGGLKGRGFPVGASGVAQTIEIIDQLKGQSGERQIEDVNWGVTQSLGGAGGTAVVSFFSR